MKPNIGPPDRYRTGKFMLGLLNDLAMLALCVVLAPVLIALVAAGGPRDGEDYA